MRICNPLQFETWVPDFSPSEKANPTWTRAFSAGLRLTNSVEWVEWSDNPVQVIICDACGYSHCARGDYVNISRLGDLVLWSAPQFDDSDEWMVSQYTPLPAVRQFGAIGVPESEWRRLQAIGDGVPPCRALAPATRRVLADIWRLSARGPARAERLESVFPLLRRHLTGADTLEPDAAIAHLEPLVAWLAADPEAPAEGTIRRSEAVGARVTILRFDGPLAHDWPALALVASKPVLALSHDLVFIPAGAA